MDGAKNLDELPTEILLHIFDYIPNKWNLSLVCWDFYEIICEIEREKFVIKLIDVRYLQNFSFNSLRLSQHFSLTTMRSINR